MGIPLEPHSYPALFCESIERGGHFLLEQLKRGTGPLFREAQEECLHLLDYLLELEELWPLTYQLLHELAPRMEQAGARHAWRPYLTRGIEQARPQGDAAGEAELHFHLGVLHLRQGEYETARFYLEYGANLFESLGNTEGLARVLGRLADVARRQHHLNKAAGLARRVLALTEEPLEQGQAYYVLGTVDYDQREWAQAQQHFQRSLDCWECTGATRQQAWGWANLGTTYMQQGEHEQAIACYEKALSLFQESNDPGQEAIVRMNVGNVYMVNLGHYGQALAHYIEAERTMRQLEDRFNLALLYNSLGMTYHRMEEWGRSLAAYKESLRLWDQVGNVLRRVNTMDNLGLLYQAMGRYEEAMATFAEALVRLEGVREEPGYERFRQMVQQSIQDLLAEREG